MKKSGGIENLPAESTEDEKEGPQGFCYSELITFRPYGPVPIALGRVVSSCYQGVVGSGAQEGRRRQQSTLKLCCG